MLTNLEKTELDQIIDYWFNHLKPEQWFRAADEVDGEIRDRFSKAHRLLAHKNLPDLNLTGQQTLAAIILFDQMSRNMFRNSAKAYETDPLARSLCFMALANKYDLDMRDLKKSFIYIPLMHSEDLNDQELSVSLLQQRTKLAIQVDYAVRHHDIIQKFGRFPHRNKHLGRVSTPEEEKFLTSGGESF